MESGNSCKIITTRWISLIFCSEKSLWVEFFEKFGFCWMLSANIYEKLNTMVHPWIHFHLPVIIFLTFSVIQPWASRWCSAITKGWWNKILRTTSHQCQWYINWTVMVSLILELGKWRLALLRTKSFRSWKSKMYHLTVYLPLTGASKPANGNCLETRNNWIYKSIVCGVADQRQFSHKLCWVLGFSFSLSNLFCQWNKQLLVISFAISPLIESWCFNE